MHQDVALGRLSRVRRPGPLQARLRRGREAVVYGVLLLCALVSVFTTLAIVAALLEEIWAFFDEVSLIEFFTDTQWTPLFRDQHFGVLPLLSATLLMSLGAMLVALPLGLAAAIFLSEYAPAGLRAVVKPVLEVLAGIPTVVYGYFALQFITPEIVRPLFTEAGPFNAASASIAMGIMTLPLVSSLSEDAMRAVPQTLREGAYGLGANRFEVALRVVVPAALSGIMAAAILAASRAIGETMIVTIAAGNMPNLSWNPLEGMQAMTAYIVQVSLGDTPRGTIEYSTIFAVGMLLFLLTLLLNIAAQWLLHRFREVYE
ncbi:MAG: phosphate ABC transporter permease subunit PstC [Chloroflexi bacterium RBG_16_68_14]|nr:MAG: phosphate ABC transporter permease subunit PstC [Chloroflexi bacterium RBG_16_68_14]